MRRLRDFASEERAAVNRRFFKTGAGQYGEGDQFLGVSVPNLRTVVREFRSLAVEELLPLLHSSWHEERLLAIVILTEHYKRGDRDAIYALYLANTKFINNWDLVDASAPQIVGAHLFERSRAPLRKLAKSKSLWERRIAIIATQHFIRQGDFDETLALAALLLRDREDLIHKAVGWMLREVGNRNRARLLSFLDAHATSMPRTMLRYAIEKFPEDLRKRYLAL
ncbi:MAG: alkylation repair enzyme [Acidobacteria bacterium]|nr:alkylation repair enzyme [Acidobacteriota bacterium]